MTRLLETAVPLDVARLEPGLRAHWERLCAEADAPPLRTVALNLIAVASADAEAMLCEAVRDLLARHPCRAFVVLLDEQGERLRADLHTLVGTEHGARQLRLERIALRLPPAEWRKVPNLIRPLLIDEVGTLAFWALPAPADPAFLRQLVQMSDQLVIDSSLLADAAAELTHLEAAAESCVDLTWLRLSPWRRALAEAFERCTWRRGMAAAARIEHGDEPGARAAAMLLGRWLGQRLGAEIELVPAAGAAAPTQPARLALRFGDTEVDLAFVAASHHVRVHVTTSSHCLLPFELPASAGSRGALLAAAADRIG